MLRGMKSHVVVLLAWLAAGSSSVAAEGFLKNLPTDQFVAAGLNKLTAEELSRLEALIDQRDAAMEMPLAGEKTEAKVNGPGWLRALVTLQETSERPDGAEAIASRLAGDYDGWSGKTVFKLENGQVWQQVGAGERIDDKRSGPAVRIYPGMMGVYWLEIEGVRERVKVRPVKLR